VTGCSGNTRGLSNSVSNFLESIANSMENKFERISSEDMLHSSKEANKKMMEHKMHWQEKRRRKLRCTKCNFNTEKLEHCHLCTDTLNTGDKSNLMETMEMHYDCEQCGQDWRCKMEQECEECGDGIYWEDQEICLLGLDVVALFPSMQSATTGRIVREHVLKSPLKIEGFDWKQGARYIVVNRKYTGDLKCLWNILPWKRKARGTAPGMKSKEMNSKKGDVEMQWSFPRREPTEQQIREMQARIAEIGVQFLFENFT
jgi:hypothetical protein